MTDLRFVQVDAFAERAFAGNPAAVIPMDLWADDATLQAIAAENNLAETAFLMPSEAVDADFDLRWFTPTVEVELCGHATLASGHVLLGDRPDLDRVRFSTRHAGVLEVRRAAAGYELDLPTHAPAGCGPFAFGDRVGAGSVDWGWHDRGYALLVYASAAEVRALDPDFRALGGIGNVLIIATAPGDGGDDVVSRVFAPAHGIDEDPVTGSAHTVIVPYWAAKLGRDRLTAFQASPRGGRLDCRLAGDRVVLGGQCTTVIEGVFRL
jgi:predicted PhzF superfamily epimerase YddE/YHI9